MANYDVNITVDLRDIQHGIDLMEQLQREINGAKNSKFGIDFDESGIQDGINAIDGMLKALQNLSNNIGDVFQSISSIGTNLGESFSQMADLFNANFVDRVETQLAQLFANAFVGHIGEVITRADITNTFAQYMSLAGVDSATASNALSRVNESILGLPIGLDESMERLRRYQMFLGDINKATDLTIGIQRAITAGGASESMQRNAYMQIDRLLTTGRLSNSRQWLSLLNGLGVSVRFLAEELGAGSMNAQEFSEALLSGEISTENFLDAVAALTYNTNLDQALEIYKTTIQSWIKNITFAMIRGGETVANAFSETLESSFGLTITGVMEQVRGGLNDMYRGIADWIGDHPEQIATFANAIDRLVATVSSLNFGEFGEYALGYLTDFVDIIDSLIGRASGGSFEQFAAFATTIAGPLSDAFQAIAAKLPALLAIFERFRDFDFEKLFDKIADRVENLAEKISWLLDHIPDEVLMDIIAFALVDAPVLAAAFHGIADAIGTIAKATIGVIGPLVAFTGALGTLTTMVSASGLGGPGIIGNLLFGMFNAIRIGDKNELSKIHELQDAISSGLDTQSFENDVARAERAANAIDTIVQNHNNKMANPTISGSLSGTIGQYGTSIDAMKAHRDVLQKEADQLHADEDFWRNRLRAHQSTMKDIIKKYYREEDPTGELEQAGTLPPRSWIIGQTGHDFYAEIDYYSSMYESARTAAQNADSAVGDASIWIEKWSADLAMYNVIAEEAAKKAEEAKKNNKDLSEAIQEYYDSLEGEVAEAFGAAGDDFDFEEWLGDVPDPAKLADNLYQQNLAYTNYRDNIKKIGEMAEATDDPRYIRAYKEILSAGPEIIQAFLNGNHDQREKILQEYFWRTSNVDRETTLLSNYLASIDAYLEEYENGNTDAKLKLYDEYQHNLFLGLIDAEDHDSEGNFVNPWTGEIDSSEYSKRPPKKGIISLLPEMIDEAIKNVDGEIAESAENVVESLAGATDKVKSASAEQVQDVVMHISRTYNGKQGEIETAAYKAGYADGALERGTRTAFLVAEMAMDEGFAGMSQNMATNGDALVAQATGVAEALRKAFAGIWGAATPSNGGPVDENGSWTSGLASGGIVGIPRPIGTDTVPTMLTPGEYVTRRAAVAAFGKDFMDKVNSIDIPGAYDALIHRATNAGLGMSYTDNRRTYDNHASVSINNYNNSQGYSQNVASRWVRALG